MCIMTKIRAYTHTSTNVINVNKGPTACTIQGDSWKVFIHLIKKFLLAALHHLSVQLSTRWFKYDWDDLYVSKSQFVPVIFEPPCTNINYGTLKLRIITYGLSLDFIHSLSWESDIKNAAECAWDQIIVTLVISLEMSEVLISSGAFVLFFSHYFKFPVTLKGIADSANILHAPLYVLHNTRCKFLYVS
jgi:hypothetical protein